jgi:hypothetical protein
MLFFLFAPLLVSTVIARDRGATVAETEKIFLKWDNAGDNVAYRFQMASDKEFRRMMIDERSNSPMISIPPPENPGTYYIRIKPLYPGGREGMFSLPQSYTISAGLNPPTILFPEEMREFRGRFDINFSWSSVPRASAYHFILARDRKFEYVFYEKPRVTDTSLLVRSLDFGTYYVKVSSLDRSGIESPFSDVRPFIVVPPPPLSIPK